MTMAEKPHSRLFSVSLALQILPLVFLLPTLSLLVFLRVCYAFIPEKSSSGRSANSQTILVTTTASTTSLAHQFARAFHAAGHQVVVASTEPVLFTSPLRVSRAVSAFYRLPTSDSRHILPIIVRERPAVWIPLAGDTTVLKELLDSEATRNKPRVQCAVIAPGEEVFRLTRDEIAFADALVELETEARGPERMEVTSRAEVHRILGASRGKKEYLAAKVQKEEAGGQRQELELYFGGHFDEEEEEQALLPKATMNETYNCIAGLRISKSEPWKLREVIKGKAHTAHSLIICGEVKAFMVSQQLQAPSASGAAVEDRAVKLLSPTSPLHSSLLNFTQTLAAALLSTSCTHFSIDFVVSTESTTTGVASQIHPVSCSSAPPPYVMKNASCAAELAALYISATRQSSELRIHSNSNTEKHRPKALPTSTKPLELSNHDATATTSIAALPTPPHSPRLFHGHPPQPHQPAHSTTTTPSTTTTVAAASLLLLVPADDTAPKGTYSLPYALYADAVQPLLALLRRPSRAGVRKVALGLLELVEKGLEWEEELWWSKDAGPWVWEWGVGRPVEGVVRVGRGVWRGVVGGG